MSFYEVVWHGHGIGDGAEIEEALQSYLFVKPEDGDWSRACSVAGANPHINRYSSFESYLDNDDCLETMTVTSEMISYALAEVT